MSIMASGKITTTTTGNLVKIKPCVWFSTNPSWENTVMKALRNPETGHEEPYYSRKAFFNCNYWDAVFGPGQLHPFIPVRIKLNKAKISLGSKEPGKTGLFTWTNYQKNSGESPSMLKALAKVGKKMGANPKDWFVSYEEVPNFNCCSRERWDGHKWVELTIDDFNANTP